MFPQLLGKLQRILPFIAGALFSFVHGYESVLLDRATTAITYGKLTVQFVGTRILFRGGILDLKGMEDPS